MTPEALAALHALSFTDTPRPWTSGEFAALLELPTKLLAALPGGFALGRVAGPEAELLTLAVHPEARRRGLGSALVAAFASQAAAAGAKECLLEVAVTNAAARGLYRRLGFSPVGRRPRYYVRAAAPQVDALVLRKPLENPLTGSGR
jgi:[ribosomal protein S18]-alanine N-acetyltransferase